MIEKVLAEEKEFCHRRETNHTAAWEGDRIRLVLAPGKAKGVDMTGMYSLSIYYKREHVMKDRYEYSDWQLLMGENMVERPFLSHFLQNVYQITESDFADLKEQVSYDTSARILQGDKRCIARIDSGYADNVYYTLERVETDYADGGKQETWHLSLGCSLAEALSDCVEEHCYDRVGVTANYLTAEDMIELRKWLETYLAMLADN